MTRFWKNIPRLLSGASQPLNSRENFDFVKVAGPLLVELGYEKHWSALPQGLEEGPGLEEGRAKGIFCAGNAP